MGTWKFKDYRLSGLVQLRVTWSRIETQRYINHYVSALDPLLYVSPGGRHHPRVRKGRALKPHCGAHLRPLAVRNAGARWTAIGVHHRLHPVVPFDGHSLPPHEGERCWRREQHRQFHRRFLLRLDADRARRDRALLRHSLGARTVEPAVAPAPVVQLAKFLQEFRSIEIAVGCECTVETTTPGCARVAPREEDERERQVPHHTTPVVHQ